MTLFVTVMTPLTKHKPKRASPHHHLELKLALTSEIYLRDSSGSSSSSSATTKINYSKQQQQNARLLHLRRKTRPPRNLPQAPKTLSRK
jgi:hypothetical protein